MPSMKDETGHVYGKWAVIGDGGPTPTGHLWLCRCSCGATRLIAGGSLRNGHTTQCTSCSLTTHGKSRTAEYRTWLRIIRRCTNTKDKDFKYYGERGIRVCKRWMMSFDAFLDDLGYRPSRWYSIGRIDNSGNYCPENCRRETASDQGKNRRNNRPITHAGVTKNLTNWAREIGITPEGLAYRIAQNWPMEKAIGPPTRKRMRK